MSSEGFAVHKPESAREAATGRPAFDAAARRWAGARMLFLQGIASPFFSRLAASLEELGVQVLRVNFCGGDTLYWRGGASLNFRGPIERLAEYFDGVVSSRAITDIVLFGDQRPVHRVAAELARGRRIRVHAFEEGYIRPNWITLERGGNNAASALPRDPRWYLRVNRSLPETDEPPVRPASIAARAAHDTAYHAANILDFAAYPYYRTHRPHPAAVEYAGWALRFARFPWWTRRDAALIQDLIEARKPYFLFPLQLNGDVQIARHSPFGHMRHAVETVLRSFAAHAPRGARLLIKNHPLDTGLFDYAGLIGRLSGELGLRDRVDYLETGNLTRLLRNTLGVVTVNSTAGFAALQQQRPTKVLGTAIYDIPGLSHQGALDAFWNDPRPPDPELCRAFRNVVIHATQVRGDFFTGEGIATAVKGCGHMLEPLSRLEQLLDRFPLGDTCAHPGQS